MDYREWGSHAWGVHPLHLVRTARVTHEEEAVTRIIAREL